MFGQAAIVMFALKMHKITLVVIAVKWWTVVWTPPLAGVCVWSLMTPLLFVNETTLNEVRVSPHLVKTA